MDGTEELPPGWAWARLGELGAVTGGLTKNPDRSKWPERVPYLRVANVQKGRLDLTDVANIGIRPEELPRVLLKPGDLLIVEGNGSLDQIGRCAVWTGDIEDCAHQNHIIKVRFGQDDLSRWVLHWLTSAGGRTAIERVASSTAGLHTLSISKIEQLPVPVAPAAERTRIMSEVEALSEELDEAEAALGRAQDALAEYRASLLHAASTGALTAAWRAAHPRPAEDGPTLLRRILAERRATWERAELARLAAKGKPAPKGDAWKARYEEPQAPDTDGLPDLPEGWVWASLPQLGAFGRGKSKHRPRDDARLYGDLVPFIQTGEVSRSNGIISRYSRSYSEFGVSQSKIWPRGTVCITIAANIAASGILDFDACFPDSVVGLTTSNESLARYVELFIRTCRNHLENYAPATAQKNINLDILGRIAVPLPPPSEQAEILRLVEDGLASCSSISDGGRDVPTLRQSILHAAFTGRLVPQDSADESAAALLARLHAVPPVSGRAPRRTRPVQEALL